MKSGSILGLSDPNGEHVIFMALHLGPNGWSRYLVCLLPKHTLQDLPTGTLWDLVYESDATGELLVVCQFLSNDSLDFAFCYLGSGTTNNIRSG